MSPQSQSKTFKREPMGLQVSPEAPKMNPKSTSGTKKHKKTLKHNTKNTLQQARSVLHQYTINQSITSNQSIHPILSNPVQSGPVESNPTINRPIKQSSNNQSVIKMWGAYKSNMTSSHIPDKHITIETTRRVGRPKTKNFQPTQGVD